MNEMWVKKLPVLYLVDLSDSNYLTFNRKSLENPWYNK